MRVYEQKIRWKRLLFLVAIVIGAISLWYTNKLVQKLATEEEKKVLMWANATKQLINANENTDINFLLDIIKDNTTIPVILVDNDSNIIANRNLDSTKADDAKYLAKQLEEMGLVELEVLDRPFDPHTAEAIDTVESEKDGIVLEVLRRGYAFCDAVIRPAQVRVGKSEN